ncbi:MAG TPA: redox-regulated ATPase YchF [Verrucomicrobia bacterium]|nr:redox-regulated ATPase YchF [Verrucomicrobiota bacterium]
MEDFVLASLQLYLIGAPRAGKSAVFDALTNTPQGPSFMTKSGHRLGTVKVPDRRLEALRDMFKPKKYTPAEVTFVDVAIPAAAETGHSFSQLNAFLGDADAFALVVQAFGEFDYAGQPLDPVRQFENLLLELAMADLEKIERRLEKIGQELKRGLKGNEQEKVVLDKCKVQLEAGKYLRDLGLSADEEKRISSFCFLSQKRILAIANVSENRLDGSGLEALRDAVSKAGTELMIFCASLEAEIASLDAAAQADFLKDYGLTEPARARLILGSYRILDLISFFTVGEDEVRAWTIRRGTPAQAAAGKIHSDIERGFIRAETVFCDDLLSTGSLAGCREKGTFRLEGKGYEVKDGDVIDFRFNA